MTVQRNVLVDIPPEKTYIQTKNGVLYVFLRTSFYRTDDNKPRSKSRGIGIKDPETNKMWPNRAYYELIKSQNDNEKPSLENSNKTQIQIENKNKTSRDVFSIGYSAVIEKCFSELNLTQILQNTFPPELVKRIKIVTAYIIKEGCVLSYIDDFSEKNIFYDTNEVITSQKISDILDELSQYEDSDFYREWIKYIGNDGYICYDVTSISTYSKMLQEAEYGYNRDKDNLPQLNIGLFVSELSRYPVYMFTYNGSVNDKSELFYVIRNIKNLGLEKIKLVLDGGFFDEERIKMMNKNGITFTVGMPIYLDESKKIIDEFGLNIYSPDNITYYTSTYAKIINDYTISGVTGNIFIGLSTETATSLNSDLNSKIDLYKIEMRNIKKYSTVIKNKKYTGLFDIKETQDNNGFEFMLNEEKVKNIRKYFGYFLIFTTDKNATANDILRCYREKDTDEKAFYEMKQYIGGRRTRIHKKSTFDGKYFVVFISLICRRWINKKLSEYKSAKHYTFKRCIMKLNDVRILQENNSIQLLKAITAEQREMLNLCGVDDKTLEYNAQKAMSF